MKGEVLLRGMANPSAKLASGECESEKDLVRGGQKVLSITKQCHPDSTSLHVLVELQLTGYARGCQATIIF